MGTQYWPMTNGGANAASGQYSDSVSFGAHLWVPDHRPALVERPLPRVLVPVRKPGRRRGDDVHGAQGRGLQRHRGALGRARTDVAVRIWTASNQRVTLGAGVYLPAYKDSGSPMLGAGIGNDVDPSVRAGYSWTIQHLVTLNAELGYVQNYYLGNLSSVWVQPRGSIDIRVSPQASLNFGVLYPRGAPEPRLLRKLHGRDDAGVFRRSSRRRSPQLVLPERLCSPRLSGETTRAGGVVAGGASQRHMTPRGRGILENGPARP